ncbi:hypothetical protein H7169_02010 [Candidatus Gracilibacteria bacterium]|nr:hypothetical protein [Candidatus Gracilibacteria bacterium]
MNSHISHHIFSISINMISSIFKTKIRYTLYGVIASASIISISAQAAGLDGVFGDYFTNMTTSCGANEAITGFNTAPATYGMRICTTFQSIVGSVLGTGIAPTGSAVVGFAPITGAAIFAPVSDNIWQKNSGNISYTGGNVGIGTPVPSAKLEVMGSINANGAIVASNNQFIVSNDLYGIKPNFPSGWSMVTKGYGYLNNNPKNVNGSIEVNDIYIRSIGKWASELAAGSVPQGTLCGVAMRGWSGPIQPAINCKGQPIIITTTVPSGYMNPGYCAESCVEPYWVDTTTYIEAWNCPSGYSSQQTTHSNWGGQSGDDTWSCVKN